MKPRIKILFVISASHKPSDRNFNHFQRVYFLSRAEELTILGTRNADFSVSASESTQIIRPSWKGKVGILMQTALFCLRGSFRNYDIVLTDPSILGISGFLAKLFGKCQWVVDIWDIPIRNNPKSNWFLRLRCQGTRATIRYLYRYADMFLVSILPEFELQYFRLPPAKMRLFRNAIWRDPEEEKSQTGGNARFTLLCMRSVYTRDMGLDVLSSAFLILKKSIHNLGLILVGHIPKNLEEQVESLRGIDGVEFHDYLDRWLLDKKIRMASVCVIPFRNVSDLAQTYPIKALEYFAAGKAVVASDIAGIRSMIRDGFNGSLYPNDDPQELANKVLLLYENEPLRQEISRHALNIDGSFDCRVKNRRIIEELRLLAGEVGP